MDHSSDFYRNIAATIAEHGRQVVAVNGDRTHPNFFYTIGNHNKMLPELLLIGKIPSAFAGQLLNKLSEIMFLSQKPYLDGQKQDVGGEHCPIIYDTVESAKRDYTVQASHYYGHSDYHLQQVLLPDNKGRYATDRLCHRAFRVPVLRPIAALMKTVQSTRVH